MISFIKMTWKLAIAYILIGVIALLILSISNSITIERIIYSILSVATHLFIIYIAIVLLLCITKETNN